MGSVLTNFVSQRTIWHRYFDYDEYNKNLSTEQVFNFLRDKNYTLSIKQYTYKCDENQNKSRLFKIYVKEKENENLSPV